MKIAFMADIHSNALALRYVLKQIRTLGIDTILIAGDFLGYYFDTEEILDQLSSFKIYACQGNHDKMYLKFLASPQNEKNNRYNYRKSFIRNTSNLRKFLENLKPTYSITLDNLRFLICHGSPWNQCQYVYPDTDLETVGDYGSLPEEIIIQGHTHYQMTKKNLGKIIINPGSIGQPRSTTPKDQKSKHQGLCRAQWATFDTNTYAISHLTTYYDGTPLIQKCLSEAPENTFIHHVLLR